MKHCPDICTAEKCRELEARIAALEQGLSLLEASFNSHTSEGIPDAHNYNPSVSVNASAFEGSILIDVAVDNESDSAVVGLPPPVFNQLTVDASVAKKELTIDVSIDDKSDSATVSLPAVENVSLDASIAEDLLTLNVDVDGISDSADINLLEANMSVTFDIFEVGEGDYLFKVNVNGEEDEDTLFLGNSDLFNSNLKGSASFQSDTLTISIADGKSQDTFETLIPIDELKNNDQNSKNSNLKVNGTVYDGRLILTVADGNSQDTVSIDLPKSRVSFGGGSGDKHIPSNLNGTATYQEEKLTISIADGESSTAFQVEIKSMDDLTKEKIDKIYQILGGDTWATSSTGNISMAVKPEKLIKTVGNVLYSADSNTLTELTVTNLLELLTAFSSVDFHRSGHHRLPATVLTSLLNTEDGNVPLQIYDSLSLSEWHIKQLDSLLGEFPLKLTYKGVNDEGELEDQEICLENISEAIAEFLAMGLSITEDSDNAVNIGMKTLVEASKAANAAITGVDYAQANAEYLGYKGNQTARDVDLTFTPGARDLRSSLQPSTQKLLGWENEDKETLVELIKKTLIGTEIIKASMFHPYQPGGSVTGDAIKQDKEAKSTANDAKWEEFKNRVNNPSGRYVVPKPKAKIRDLTIDNPTE